MPELRLTPAACKGHRGERGTLNDWVRGRMGKRKDRREREREERRRRQTIAWRKRDY